MTKFKVGDRTIIKNTGQHVRIMSKPRRHNGKWYYRVGYIHSNDVADFTPQELR